MDVNNYQNMLRKSCKSVMRHCVRSASLNARPMCRPDHHSVDAVGLAASRKGGEL